MDPGRWGQRLDYSQNVPRIAPGWGKKGLLGIDMNCIIAQLGLREKMQILGEIRAARGLSRASLLCNTKRKSSNHGFSNETGARMNCMGERNGQRKGKKKNKKGKE